eukprot:TRINITY_DN514_c0_g2_i1.p1 TRINITY_DN514_c0_g2~~TRINITY_DN514_c0_g2_i1.p1  ORF type:complete len:456 (-),score=117.55 TRINITY_DN514_c0_g2_i1:8-1375(-)
MQFNDHKYGIIYFLPYNNNLDQFEGVIRTKIRSSYLDDKNKFRNNLEIMIFSKTREDKGIKKEYMKTNEDGNVEVEEDILVDINDFSDEKTFKDMLNCVEDTMVKVKSFIMSIMGHGGAANEICPEEENEENYKYRWLDIEKLGKEIEDFRERIKLKEKEIELIYLQNCCKGTLESFYALKDATRYIIGSETELGAPNDYYQSLIDYLCHQEVKEVTIDGIIDQIIFEEAESMFDTLISINLEKIETFVEDLESMLVKIINGVIDDDEEEELIHYINNYSLLYKITYSLGFKKDEYYDMNMFFNIFKQLAKKNRLDEDKVNSLISFFENELVTKKRIKQSHNYKHLSGMSILFPLNQPNQEIYSIIEYSSLLSIYNQHYSIIDFNHYLLDNIYKDSNNNNQKIAYNNIKNNNNNNNDDNSRPAFGNFLLNYDKSKLKSVKTRVTCMNGETIFEDK